MVDTPNACRATRITVSDDDIFVQLADGRVLSVPIRKFRRLATATSTQRKHHRLVGDGVGINWPDIDEDLSVQGLLCESHSALEYEVAVLRGVLEELSGRRPGSATMRAGILRDHVSEVLDASLKRLPPRKARQP